MIFNPILSLIIQGFAGAGMGLAIGSKPCSGCDCHIDLANLALAVKLHLQ